MKLLSKERQELKNKVEKLGVVDWNLFNARIRIGWNEEVAANTPKFARKGAKCKHKVFYKGKSMTLTFAMKMLCDEFNVWGRKVLGVYKRSKIKKQTIQQAFDHFVKLYHKKYGN